MPFYNYQCHDCEAKLLRKLKRAKREMTIDDYEQFVLFETAHAINPTPKELKEAIICPRCKGTNCEKSMHGCNVLSYVRGNGYLDKAGAIRDMNLHHLAENDPYSEYRVPGEVDDLKSKIKKAGQHQGNAKHYVPQKEMEKAVTKAVHTPDPTPKS